MKRVLVKVWWWVQRCLCVIGHHDIVEVTEDGYLCHICGYLYTQFDAQADMHAGGGPIFWSGPTYTSSLHSEDGE